MTGNMKLERVEIRILRFLAKGEATTREAAVAGRFLLDGDERGVIGADSAAFSRLENNKLLQRAGRKLSLTKAGHDALKTLTRSTDLLRAQPSECDNATIDTADGPQPVVINQAESPLNQLYRRKGKHGRSFIDTREFRAGERLRADYTRGQIMPRLGINWSGTGMTGQSHDRASGIIELTDAALAARRRVEKAIEAIGPELAGVLIDTCCFLKGMEQVEMERSWPARSAKVVLKSALGALARHYEPPRRKNGQGEARSAILH